MGVVVMVVMVSMARRAVVVRPPILRAAVHVGNGPSAFATVGRAQPAHRRARPLDALGLCASDRESRIHGSRSCGSPPRLASRTALRQSSLDA